MKRVLSSAAIVAAILTTTSGLASAQPVAAQPVADSGSAVLEDLSYKLGNALLWLDNGSSELCTAPAGLCG